jgi:hypothetical protein
MISTANAQSHHDAEALGGPHAKFLREAETSLKPIAAQSRWKPRGK